MTPEEADKMQEWAGMPGAIAWHLIDRHADNWNEVGELMNAWLRAHVLAERADSDRLEWLLRNVSGAEFRRMGIVYHAGCSRADIDAAMCEQEASI